METIFAFAETILGSLDFLVIQNVQFITNKMTNSAQDLPRKTEHKFAAYI